MCYIVFVSTKTVSNVTKMVDVTRNRKEMPMSEKQTQTIEKLAENMKNWNDEQKGYLLGFIEGVSQANKQEEKKEQ